VITLSSSELFSHPDKTLREHLHNVSGIALSGLRKESPDFSSIGVSDEILEMLVRLITLSHDFGKSTKYFQNYLEKSIKTGKKDHNSLTNHGLISAVFCYYVTGRELEKYDIRDENTIRLAKYLAYETVKRHHGDIGNLQTEVLDLNDENRSIVKMQAGSIDVGSIKKVYSGDLDPDYIESFFQSPEEIAENLMSEQRKFGRNIKRLSEIRYAILEQYIFSLLVSADKKDASGLDIKQQNIILEPDLPEHYIQKIKYKSAGGQINTIRDEIFQDINSKAATLDLDNKIYSINVPTGGGKTLAALGFALKLRQRIGREKGLNSRIIYSLPFTSIIDQNFSVFEDVYEEYHGKKPSTDILLKHHHLAELFYNTGSDEEYSTSESKLLIEGWNSEIVVTTFVQLFHSVFSNRNRSLIKYHNIVNSIILLDEVQSIPPKYWRIFREYLKAVSEVFNIYFVFITATQPLIFYRDGEIFELCSGRDKYFRAFNRTKIIYNKDPVPFEDFKEICAEDLIENPDSDFLFVMNTKNSARNLYLSIKDSIEDAKGTEFIFLSTYIVPIERKRRIEKIRELKGKKRLVVVSTQLVEAGVDIDLDIVYRDIGPLDSINQVAGRCNRNSSKRIGIVNIYTVCDENERPFSKYIYDVTLLDKTKKVLESYDEIREPDFLDMNNRYFKYLAEAVSNDESKQLRDYFYKLDLASCGDKFKLIDKDYPEVDVFVSADEEAEWLWNRYREIKEIENLIDRRNEFYRIKPDFLNYVISVPLRDKNHVGYDSDLDMGFISSGEVGQNLKYNHETGYIRPEKDGGSSGTYMI
jgi:CRISPR-associated endonuclease/helicase Cas3